MTKGIQKLSSAAAREEPSGLLKTAADENRDLGSC